MQQADQHYSSLPTQTYAQYYDFTPYIGDAARYGCQDLGTNQNIIGAGNNVGFFNNNGFYMNNGQFDPNLQFQNGNGTGTTTGDFFQ